MNYIYVYMFWINDLYFDAIYFFVKVIKRIFPTTLHVYNYFERTCIN